MLTVALPKGRLIKQCMALLGDAFDKQIDFDADSRKLLFEFPEVGIKALVVKPVDIPTYVEIGAADIGIIGKDVLVEQEKDIYEPLDLGFGYCRLVVAEYIGQNGEEVKNWSKVRIATKYPNITEKFFSRKGIPVEMIKLSGSVELAPLVGLAGKIVDLVSTGETLRQNGLVERETIMEATARLVVNKAGHKMKHKKVTRLIERLADSLAQPG